MNEVQTLQLIDGIEELFGLQKTTGDLAIQAVMGKLALLDFEIALKAYLGLSTDARVKSIMQGVAVLQKAYWHELEKSTKRLPVPEPKGTAEYPDDYVIVFNPLHKGETKAAVTVVVLGGRKREVIPGDLPKYSELVKVLTPGIAPLDSITIGEALNLIKKAYGNI